MTTLNENQTKRNHDIQKSRIWDFAMRDLIKSLDPIYGTWRWNPESRQWTFEGWKNGALLGSMDYGCRKQN